MNEHFIKNIEIKNFKCFENFKAEGFGRVNLIGGKNNVGKTAFMEVCYLTLQKKEEALIQTFIIREKRNYVDAIKENNIHKNIEQLVEQSFKISINNNKPIEHNIFKKTQIKYININIQNVLEPLTFNIQFLDNGLMDKQLERLFAYFQEENREDIFNQYIKELDSSIQNFKFIQSAPKLQVNNKYLHLSNFGDGLKIYVSIICSLYACQNGQLFIDELDNGIHYTNLDKLWKVILTISKEQNVQVFATTHSKECIESYARVARKLEDEEITFIKMTRLDDGSIMAGVRDYDMLQYTMSDGHEVRGV